MESPTRLSPIQPPKKDNLSFGFPVFLLSESVVFISFFITYIVLRLKTPNWFPPEVTGLDTVRAGINTMILVSSSIVIYFAEKSLKRQHLVTFRRLWLSTIFLGIIFLILQGLEWSHMPFGLDEGLAGGTFYLLTGFHGLHVLTGVILMLLMYFRSLVPDNYASGHYGASAVSLFWHFVDIIWIILFILLYLW